MKKISYRACVIVFATWVCWHGLVLLAQTDATEQGCSEAALQQAIEQGTADMLAENPEAASQFDLAYIYAVGEISQQFALDCDYVPTLTQVETQIEQTLALAPLSMIIAASSIGYDAELALLEIETLRGDSFTGQLLYNGIELGLDGTALGCAGCHNGITAPSTEATYTRIEEVRLILPQFADYSVEQYLVESILQPAAYVSSDYEAVHMTDNYGGRLDAQQLADLVAFLMSQDQVFDQE